MNVLLVALAGAVGAPARYLLDVAVQRLVGRDFPWGTVLINVTGSLLLGLITGLSLPVRPALVVGTGFCGAYTTFSTFTFETVQLARQVSVLRAVGYVVLSVAAGLAGAAAGLALAEL